MSERILVIDDEAAIRKSFSLALEDTGFRVDTAPFGEEGIRMHHERPYDLIFLDLKMPGLNGIDTLREIRKVDAKTPVYIVTAFHAEFFDDLKASAAAGIDFEVMRKPIGADDIALLATSVLTGPQIQ